MPATTTPQPPAASGSKGLMERDMERIVSILRETVDQITERHERQLEKLYQRTVDLKTASQELQLEVRGLKERLNEAAVALLQR